MYVPSTRKVISSYNVLFDKSFSNALSYTSRSYSEAMVMRLAVTFTLYATSSKEQTGNIFTFAQSEEVNILTETRNDAESGDKSDNESIMISEQDMDNINYGDDSDHNIISTVMLEDIRDGSQTHLNVDRREARYKIRDCIRQKHSKWKRKLKATRSIGKGLHKVFSTIVKNIFARIDTFGRIWFRSFPFSSRTKRLC